MFYAWFINIALFFLNAVSWSWYRKSKIGVSQSTYWSCLTSQSANVWMQSNPEGAFLSPLLSYIHHVHMSMMPTLLHVCSQHVPLIFILDILYLLEASILSMWILLLVTHTLVSTIQFLEFLIYHCDVAWCNARVLLDAWFKYYDLVLLNKSITSKEEDLFDQCMNCSLLPREQDHCPFCSFWLFKLLCAKSELRLWRWLMWIDRLKWW